MHYLLDTSYFAEPRQVILQGAAPPGGLQRCTIPTATLSTKMLAPPPPKGN